MRRPSKRTIIIAAAGLVLALAGGGTALAATSSIPDANGVIHGCYGNTGSVRVIDTDAGQACKSNETGLNWNQTGPQGPQGLQGPQGATGATGATGPSTAGPDGLDVIVVTATFPGEAVAVCPASNPYAIGGGAESSGGIYASFPAVTGLDGSQPTEWAALTNDGSTSITAYAVCAK